MKRIVVKSSKKYTIIIDKGILSETYERIQPVLKGSIVYIVTDDIVDSLYGSVLADSFKNSGIHAYKYVIPNGEISKNSDNYISILNDMANKGISRSDTLIAFGGGVPGDLGGFAAATYQRGISLIQIPTTCLPLWIPQSAGKRQSTSKKERILQERFISPTWLYVTFH